MNTEGLRILHVLNDFPFPPHHGGRVDCWGRVKALAELGHRIHLVATVREQPADAAIQEVSKRVHRLDIVRRRGNAAGIWSGLTPGQVVTRDALRGVPLESGYDVVLLESEFVSAILENPALRCDRRVLRVHNDESDFLRQTGDSEWNPLRKAYYRIESARFRRWSPRVYSAMDQLWFISRDGLGAWQSKNSAASDRAFWLPPAIDLCPTPRGSIGSRQVMFAGNLVAPTNLNGLTWYLKEVHPRLRNIAGYRFLIAGSVLGRGIPRLLADASVDPQCNLLLDHPDLTASYSESAVFVNPMRYGASLKLKTVNAVEHGMPVVTTTVGNEGTGLRNGEHLMVRDDAPQFADAVSGLLSDAESGAELARAGQAFLREHYDHKSRIRELLDRLFAN